MEAFVQQIPALAGVLVGALATYAATSAAERSRWRRQQSVRWDDKRFSTYAEYAHSLKQVISISLRLAAHRGIHPDSDVLSPEEGLPALAAAEAERTMKWEAVLLLGSKEAVIAARSWHHAVFRLEQIASGRPCDMTWAQAIDAASVARGKFYQVARLDIGVSIGDSAEAYEWQISKLIGVSGSPIPLQPQQGARAPVASHVTDADHQEASDGTD